MKSLKSGILKLIVFALGLVATSAVQSQVSVSVFDAKDSIPLTGAVLVAQAKNHVFSTAADYDGLITIPAKDMELLGQSQYKIFCTGFEPLQLHSLVNNKSYYLKSLFISTSEVVVTGQYTPRSIAESVHSIKVIDSRKIERIGAVSLDDVLSNELFIQLSQDNILGTGLNLQGVSGENIKILRDGVPVIGRLNGNIDLSQLNLADIGRIEIVEGPLSVAYGTNALGGTINLISKRPLRQTSCGGINLFTDNSGHYNASVNYRASIRRHSITANAYRNFFDGWSEGEKDYFNFKKQLADSSRWKQWKPREQYGAELGYTYHLKKWNLGIRSNYFTETILNRQLPMAPYFERAFDDKYFTRRFDNSAQFNYNGENNRRFTGFIAMNHYTRHKNVYARDLVTLSEQLTSVPEDQDTTKFILLSSRATYSANPNSWLRYELGYDINLESAIGERIDADIQNQNDYAGFASAELTAMQKLVIRPALRYSYNTRYDIPLIPSLNLKWTSGHYDIRASAARGFRAPTLKELFLYFVDSNHNIRGNTELQSEDSWYYSAQLARRFEFKTGDLRLSAGVFLNDITNMITLAQIEGIEYSYFNIGKYTAHGGSLDATLHYGNLENTVGVSITGRSNRLDESVVIEVPHYYYTNELRWNLSYDWIKYQLSFSSFLKYQGKLEGYNIDDFGDVSYSMIDPYTMWDISVSKKMWKQRLTATGGLRNLLNVTNVSSLSGTGSHGSSIANTRSVSTGRLFFVSLSFQFSKQKDS